VAARILGPAHSTGTTKVASGSDGIGRPARSRARAAWSRTAEGSGLLLTLGPVLAIALVALPLGELARLPVFVRFAVLGTVATPPPGSGP